MLSLYIIGAHVGSIISFPLSAILCEYGFDGGWPSVFYVFGEVHVCMVTYPVAIDSQN